MMKIVNIRKDGSVIEDFKTIFVPKEIMITIRDISERKTDVGSRIQNGNQNTSRAG